MTIFDFSKKKNEICFLRSAAPVLVQLREERINGRFENTGAALRKKKQFLTFYKLQKSL